MKKSLLLSLILTALAFLASNSFAQAVRPLESAAHPISRISNDASSPATASQVPMGDVIQTGKLPPSIALAGVKTLPIHGVYFLQSNGRALHNIQIDPSNPSVIHVCVQQTTSATPLVDSVNQEYPSRRVMYMMSTNGGDSWSTPVVFSTVKTGFPSMILVKHNNQYIPVIAAHRLVSAGSTDIISALYIKQPDGTFTEVKANRNAAGGTTENILWPSIAANAAGDSIFVIGDISRTPATFDYMQFGSFKLNYTETAITGSFNGWTAQIGSQSGNYPTAGWSSGGDHVIHVADNGNIGVEWLNVTQDQTVLSDGIYFNESTDGGQTWPKEISPLVVTGDPITTLNNAQDVPSTGMDFWYVGNTPHFIWGSVASLPATSPSAGGTFYPTAATLSYWDGNSSDSVRHVISRLWANPIDTAGWAVHEPVGSQIDPQGSPIFSYPTVARTSNPNIFTVFFQGFTEGDSAEVTLMDGSTKEYLYSSIYRISTTDGGATWSQSTLVQGNSDASAPKLDYRYPESSEWNDVNTSVADYHILYQVDSLPGYLSGGGIPSFDYNFYSHQDVPVPVIVNAVKSAAPVDLKLNANFPNPFAASTNVSFELAASSDATLIVEDMLGRPVATLFHGHLAAGPHSMNFNAANLPDGVYRYTLTTDAGTVSKTMTHIK